MAQHHGSEYQVKVIHEDGTETLSDWIEHGDVGETMAAFRKPKSKAYWLRERSISFAACPCCQNHDASIAEYPLTYSLSQGSHPRDSSYLAKWGSNDGSGLPAIFGRSAGR
jgi:hypothetical protein